jgi:hypothetical protein
MGEVARHLRKGKNGGPEDGMGIAEKYLPSHRFPVQPE